MKKINLLSYKIQIKDPQGQPKEADYRVKDSLVEILFNPELKLRAAELLKQDVLSKKIFAAEDFVLLEDEEYERVEKALATVKGFNKNDVEFVKRITEPEDYDVGAK